MKQFQQLTKKNSKFLCDQCAHAVLDVIPLIMRVIRSEMRQNRKRDLSVPQFRTLGFLTHYPHSSLSQLSEHLGLKRPTASKLVDALVERDLIVRETSAADRRVIQLILTSRGTTIFDTALKSIQAQLAERLSSHSGSELKHITSAIKVLRRAFESG
jgi:DNA-binding MarR family transcriptional regulator